MVQQTGKQGQPLCGTPGCGKSDEGCHGNAKLVLTAGAYGELFVYCLILSPHSARHVFRHVIRHVI